jgi:hypothetical protein
MLEALCYPTREPAAEITEQSAERLIKLAGQKFPPDGLAGLIIFARGGGSEALCKLFRTVALNAQSSDAHGEIASSSAPLVNSRRSSGHDQSSSWSEVANA